GLDGGAMDGFTAANVDPNDPTGSRTMGFYDSSDLPFYYALYSTFAMADHYFCSALTQTFPNRFYLLAGTSFGHIRNDFPSSGTEFSQPTIFNNLDNGGVTREIYYHQVAFAPLVAYVRCPAAPHAFPVQRYIADGHSPTPRACTPDDIEPMLQCTGGSQDGQPCMSDAQCPGGACDVPGHFDRYGIWVPFVVVSPFARKHYVSHKVYDHTSILRFIETRFDLPALTRRDANADPMLKLFRFRRPSFPTPPTLPAAVIDQSQQQEPECVNGANGT